MSREKTDKGFCPEKIDLHIHSTFSDGTDTPKQILEHAREIGLDLFSITDHDAVKAGPMIRKLRKEGDPVFVTGVEFSCKDENGKYHILGYGYDPEAQAVQSLVEKSHSFRLEKVHARLAFLRDEYGFVFPEKEIEDLFALENPGKPHLGNITAGSDYHGSNKRVRLADTGCPDAAEGPTGLQDFLKAVLQ